MKKLISKLSKNRMKFATLVAIIIMPLIYAGLYLWAFWDPYNKINQIPVAVVNQDQGSNNENLGNDLVQKLKDNQAMKWNFVDINTAENGLEQKKYYSMVIIPSDFTKKIINADKKDATKTYLEYKNREASNFMAAKFSTSAYNKIQSALNSEIAKRYFDESFKESLKSADKLKDAIKGATDLKNGLYDLATGSGELNDGINKAYDGSDKVNNGANDTYNGADKLKSGIDTLQSGANSLQPLLLAMNTYQGDNHDPKMKAYLSQLNSAMAQTSTGINQLQSGASDLKNGLNDLKNGTNDLRIGIDKLKTGSQDIHSNLLTAEDGANTLATKMEKNRQELIQKIKDQNSDILSKPVELTDNSYDLVENNGTGFTPYFGSLSLWVGSMAIFFLIELKKGKKLPKIFQTLLINVIQAVVLGLVLIKALGLRVQYLGIFFSFSILLSTCFGLIQFFLTNYFKDVGRFISIILLILQLTSCSGSYPLETTPVFFQKISSYLPMTYSVNAYREIISGGNLSLAASSIRTIFITTIIFLLVDLASAINWHKIKLPKKHGKRK